MYLDWRQSLPKTSTNMVNMSTCEFRDPSPIVPPPAYSLSPHPSYFPGHTGVQLSRDYRVYLNKRRGAF